MKKELLPEAHPLYHNTQKLLQTYRDALWSLQVSSLDLQAEFRAEYGSTLDYCLANLSRSGINLENTKIESYARSLSKSQKMIKLIDSAVGLLRQKHKRGELYYWILYYTYLSPQEFDCTDDLLHAIGTRTSKLSLRTYYNRRKEAIEVLSSILWGYTSKECREALECFSLSEHSPFSAF